MKSEPETHYDVIKEVSNEGWNFNQQFVRALIHSKKEYKDKHPLAYAMGAEVEETGKHFCSYCDEYLTDQACSGFEDTVRDVLRREVIEPYMERHCPDCEERLEGRQIIQEVDCSSFEAELGDVKTQKVGVNEKRQYQPCGCLFEIGEEKILWDLDKDKVEEEVSLYGYNGKIFNE